MNKCRKNNNRLKKLKTRKMKKEENSTELQKPNVEVEVYDSKKKKKKKMCLRKKKKKKGSKV